MLLPQDFRRTGEEMQRAVCVRAIKAVGKLGVPTPATTTTTEHVDTKSSRLFIFDKVSGTKFLIDTGADVSVIPHQGRKTVSPTDIKIYAANGTHIDNYGDRLITLDLGLRRPFQWRFCVANVSKPIIGADFIGHFGLLVDLKNRQLIDAKTNLTSRGFRTSTSLGSISSMAYHSPYAGLLAQYSDVISPTHLTRRSNRTVTHHIVTSEPLVHERPRRLSADKVKAARAEFQYMLERGICRPSTSLWASPWHLVKKKSGD